MSAPLARVMLACGCAVALLGAPRRAAAQASDPRTQEVLALRAAGALESQSRFPEAEAVLRRLLDAQPGSTAGVFALDRIEHAQAQPLGALPYARRYLETDPTSEGVRFLELRLLTEADSLDAASRALEAWIALEPSDPAAYRETAPLWEKTFGPDRALELLRRGARASRDPAELALPTGDLLYQTGHVAEAAAEWARAADGGNDDEVLRRVARVPAGTERAHTADALIAALEREPSTPIRRMLAVRAALSFGMTDHGLALARTVEASLPRATRQAFLEAVARTADEASAPAVSLWALGELRPLVNAGLQGRTLDARIQRTALAVGDTAAALAATRRLADALPKQSEERRHALAERIRLEAGRAPPDSLVAQLDALGSEYSDAPELDELAALLAVGLQSHGQNERAAQVIARAQGPQSSLERAYLLLGSGDVAGARTALTGAVPGLPPARATDVIQLSALLGRLGPEGAAAVAHAAVQAHRGDGRAAGLALERAVPGLPTADRAEVLAEAARVIEDAGGDADAARMRGVLVQSWPDAPESAEAALALARWQARTPSGRAAAIKLLEDLIVRSPQSAVAPAARRELDRLKQGT